MSTHNICFRREIRKIICGYPLLSVAMDEGNNMLNGEAFLKGDNSCCCTWICTCTWTFLGDLGGRAGGEGCQNISVTVIWLHTIFLIYNVMKSRCIQRTC